MECPDVDILAHPGLIELDDAYLAAEKKVYLEITARRGHSLTNGHVAKIANLAGARIILDSDAHEPQDLLNVQLAESIARGAGLETDETHTLLWHNPTLLLQKLGVSP